MGVKRAREDEEGKKEPVRCSGAEAWITESFLRDSISLPAKTFYCGLCFNPMVMPVELHPNANDSQEKRCLACKECVLQRKELLRGAGKSLFDCPLCRESVNIFLLEQLQEGNSSHSSILPTGLDSARNFSCIGSTVDASSSFKTCGACEKVASHVFCMQCGFALCRECQSTMHSKKCFQHHEVVPLELAGRAAPSKCPIHESHHLDLFCFDCQCTGCVLCCFSGAHKGHHVTPLCEAAAKAESIISSAMLAAKKRANDAALEKKKLSDCVRDFKAEVEETREKISGSFAQIKKTLESREEELISELEAKISPNLRALQQGVETSAALEAQGINELDKLEFLKKEGQTALAHFMIPLQQHLKEMEELTSDLQNTLDTMIDRTRTKLNTKTLVEKIAGKFSMGSSPSDGNDTYKQFLDDILHIGNFSFPHDAAKVEERKEEESQDRKDSIRSGTGPISASLLSKPFSLVSSPLSTTPKLNSEKRSDQSEAGHLFPVVPSDTMSTVIPAPLESSTISTISFQANPRHALGHSVTTAPIPLSMLSSVPPQTQPSGTSSSTSHFSFRDPLATKSEIVKPPPCSSIANIFSSTSLNVLRCPNAKMSELQESSSKKDFSGLENVFQ